MKDLRSFDGLCLELPRGMAVSAREASRSDGGLDAVRPLKSDGLQPGGSVAGVIELLLAFSSVRADSIVSSTGAVIDQWMEIVGLPCR